MARKPLMVGNWKMNETIGEAVVLAQNISNNYADRWKEDVDVAVCPPFVDIKPVKTVFDFDKAPITVGAQNVYWEPSGAYTGEISVPMLAEIGCTWCIVGHSERRTLFGETNEDVNLKVKALLEGGILPIVCVGESLAIRDQDQTIPFVCAQVRAAFAGVTAAELKGSVIAYEPIWAIGTGRTATPEQAEEVCKSIRIEIGEMYGPDVAHDMRILYGGSMNPGNVDMLIQEDDIDGGLIGGASLEASSFVALVNACLK